VPHRFGVFLFVLFLSTAAIAQPATPDATTWVADLASRYGVTPNIAYLAGNQATLDVYAPRNAGATAPVPAVIYFHGGGWTGGDKAVALLRALPYLEMGWAVVNVNYRLGLAPAAVEDCRCALRWVIRNATKYHVDVNKLVVTGDSAGSHLALTTGMLPESAGLDRQCPGRVELKVAAIVNWYGVTDVADLLDGANQQPYAVRWLSGVPDRDKVARRVSPLEYVRAGLPPILTVHGEADSIAPYSHAVRLHKALDAVKVPNQLLTIPGGDHGSFTRDDFIRIYATIREFLNKHGVAK
jgi:acetyl esterase/lipase